MTKTITELTAFWSRCDLKSHPFAHPDDLPILSRGANSFIDVAPIKAFEGFVAGERFGAFDDHRFHLSLLPIPYGGDIANADIIILLLNPGFGYTDYYAEMRVACLSTET